MAPRQLLSALVHVPSTQFALWTAFNDIVRIIAFADSIVPVHMPETLANGPAGTEGVEGAGEGDAGVLELPHDDVKMTRSERTTRRTAIGLGIRKKSGS